MDSATKTEVNSLIAQMGNIAPELDLAITILGNYKNAGCEKHTQELENIKEKINTNTSVWV